MKTKEWYNKLTYSDDLVSVLPMQVQAGLPFPIEKDGKLYFYVPFYHMMPQKNEILISPVLFSALFNAGNLHAVSFENIADSKPELYSQVLYHGAVPGTGDIYRLSLNIDYLLELLDNMRDSLNRTGVVKHKLVEEYRKKLPGGLIVKEMIGYYNI